MRKKEFLEELKEHLIGLSEDDMKEILEDYEEHFKIGKKNKRKESEIAESLGTPKEIAREVRRELSGSEDAVPLKTSLIELWVDTKKVLKKAWRDIKKATHKLEKKIDVNSTKKKTKKKKKESTEKTKTSAWKTIALVCLNLFIVAWIIISIYAVILSLFAAGIAIWISGLATMIASVFVLLNPVSSTLHNLSIAGIFGGFAILLLGSLWLRLSVKLTAGVSWLVKKYFKLNRRLSRK